MPTLVELVPIVPPELRGDPWKDYLRKAWPEIGFEPWDAASSIGRDLQERFQERSDPGDWLAFASKALGEVWRAMPEEIRDKAWGLLDDLAKRALENAADLGINLGKLSEGMSEAIPIIGAAIDGIVQAVVAGFQARRELAAINRDISNAHRQMRQMDTLAKLSTPQRWVYSRVDVENYTAFRGGTTWRRQPSFGRSLGETALMFEAVAGAKDKGNCAPGTEYKCPVFRSNGYEDCEPKRKGDEKNNCRRQLAVSALFYPYWSPAYPAGAIPIDWQKQDPNALLISRQTALLTNPDANLRVRASSMRSLVSRFRRFYLDALKQGARRVNDLGAVEPGSERQRVDTAEVRELGREGFFFRGGLIHPYGNEQTDQWGVPAIGGAARGNMAVTIAQYNAVVAAELSFFTARAQMLRNTKSIGLLVERHGASSYDAEAQAAMKYARAQYDVKVDYLPSPQTLVGSSGGAPMLLADPGGSGGGAALLALGFLFLGIR
jgi:hypothetical protein